jgi:hypothetical protein
MAPMQHPSTNLYVSVLKAQEVGTPTVVYAMTASKENVREIPRMLCPIKEETPSRLKKLLRSKMKL